MTKERLEKFDIHQDELAVKVLKEQIASLEEEMDGIRMYSNSDEKREMEEFIYEQKQVIPDKLWCKIVGFLGAFLIYGLLLVVRLLIGIGLKGGLPSFEEVYTILE